MSLPRITSLIPLSLVGEGASGTIVGVVLASLAAFFLLRPAWWRRLLFSRADPRPAALFRILFGTVLLATFCLFGAELHWLFTDEGLWLPQLARSIEAHELDRLWDRVVGFQNVSGMLQAILGRFSVFHLRNDPPIVLAVYGLSLAFIVLMTLGIATRWTTFATWVCVTQFYAFSSVFHTGWDQVARVFLFLALFLRWGEAYSVDSAWRRRRALMGGATTMPAAEMIPAWPMNLMMFQLTLIYCTSGLAKNHNTWWNGTALFYIMNLEEVARLDMTGLVALMHWTGVLPVATYFVHFWEVLFPIALFGRLANRRRDADSVLRWRRRASWVALSSAWLGIAWLVGEAAWLTHRPEAAPFKIGKGGVQLAVTALVAAAPLLALGAYHYLRRRSPRGLRIACSTGLWLGTGLVIHLGIGLFLNVGLFSLTVISTYCVWLTGEDIDRLRRVLSTRPLAPGLGERPLRRGWRRWFLAPWDRLSHRQPCAAIEIAYRADVRSVRRVAEVRAWDGVGSLRFRPDPGAPRDRLCIAQGEELVTGAEAGALLVERLPGLWLLRWAIAIHHLRRPAGAVALRLLGQR